MHTERVFYPWVSLRILRELDEATVHLVEGHVHLRLHAVAVLLDDQLRREKGLQTDYLRIRAFPFSQEVRAFVERHPRVYVVEQNRDGQLAALLKLDLPAELTPRLRSLAHIPGLPLDARSVTDEISEKEGR